MNVNTKRTDLSGENLNATLLVTNRALAPAVEYIKDRFDILYTDEINENSPLRNVTGLLSSGWDQIDKPLLNKLPNLKIISHLANGLDSIDLQTTQDRKIALFNTPDAVVNDTADLAMAFIINLSRRFVINHKFVEQGLWGKQTYALGQTLTNKRVGIVGLGKIGKTIAKRCSAFDMQIHYWGRTDQNIESYTYHQCLSVMAKNVDFLVVSCAGNAQTRSLINKQVFANLKPSAFVVNVARGFVINQADLIDSLQTNQIAGAGLDVFEDEPNVPNDLLNMENVIVQPHAGSATQETRSFMFWQVANHLVQFYNRH